MGRQFVFPLKVLWRDSLQFGDGVELELGEDVRAVGFIPVYESLQALVEDHGVDCDYGTFQERDATGDGNGQA